MPNVVAAPAPARLRAAAVPDRLVMVGLFDHVPNAEGLTWFADQVWPSLSKMFPTAQLHAIGRFGADLAARLPSVCFHGFVDDLASEYDRAAVVVAPVRSGGGTQIKVIEALAHGRPLVSSTFAHSGFAEELVAGESLLTADTASDWVAACRTLLSNSEAAETMGRQGARQVSHHYGLDRMKRGVRSTLDLLRDGL